MFLERNSVGVLIKSDCRLAVVAVTTGTKSLKKSIGDMLPGSWQTQVTVYSFFFFYNEIHRSINF